MIQQTTQQQVEKYVDAISSDPVTYVNRFLGKTPSSKQVELLKATETHKHILAIWSRQTGKSTELGRVVSKWLVFGEGVTNKVGEHIPETIYVFAPILDQVRNLYYKIKKTIDSNPYLSAYTAQMNMDQIIMKGGQRCVFRSASPGSHIRGPTATKIIIDESQDISDAKYYGDILPMGATTGAPILETGTAKDKNHFYKTMQAALKVGSRIKLIMQKWYECPFIDKDFVLSKKEENEAFYNQEFMCVFNESGSTCFPNAWFDRQKNGRWLLWDYKYYTSIAEIEANIHTIRRIIVKMKYEMVFNLGIDLGKENDSTVLTIFRTDKFPCTMIYQEEIPLGKSYVYVVGIVKILNDLFQFNEVNVDYTSEKSFVDMLVENGVPVTYDKSYRTGTVVFNTATKTQMINKLQILIQKSLNTDTYLIALPKSAERLILQCTQQQYEVTGNGKYKYYHPTNTHDDMLWSTLLALKNVSIVTDETIYKEEKKANPWISHDAKVGRTDDPREIAVAQCGRVGSSSFSDKSRWSRNLAKGNI